jgi:predicted nucleic acid-binding protein
VIVYFDTSALVPLLIAEPTSEDCRRIWEDADDVATCRLGYVEAAAALAQAQRLERISERDHLEALRGLEQLWAGLAVVEVDADLTHRSAQLAARFGLRGYDAVHCAAAELLASSDLIAASGDRALLSAWSALGIASLDTRAP